MLTGTPPAKHGVLHRSIDIELRTDPHVHNSVPAAWACLDSFGLALRAETTSPIYSDASPTLPACRFSAPSVAERSRPSASLRREAHSATVAAGQWSASLHPSASSASPFLRVAMPTVT